MDILACVDASPYAPSVCDHAAWFCGHLHHGSVTLLHAVDGLRASDVERLLSYCRLRLEDQGVSNVRVRCAQGPLAEVLAGEGADLVLLGKRGEGRPDDAVLGETATAVLHGPTYAICLVSRLFLPIHRGLVLIDSDIRHRRTIQAVAATAALRDLELDIVMMRPPRAEGAEKLAWARATLGGARTDVYPLSHAAPEAMAAQYMAEHGTDLIVFSREMLFASRPGPEEGQRRPVWSWRAPVFVC